MIKTYLKYRSTEEILDALGGVSFDEFRLKAIERIVNSDLSDYEKIKDLKQHRGFGNTTEMLVESILAAQEESVLLIVVNESAVVYTQKSLTELLTKLELDHIKSNFTIKSKSKVIKNVTSFNKVFIDASCQDLPNEIINLI